MYKCARELILDRYDDDGEVIDGEYFKVEKNSNWFISQVDSRIIEGEIRLEAVDDSNWIEIDKETLAKHFVYIQDN